MHAHLDLFELPHATERFPSDSLYQPNWKTGLQVVIENCYVMFIADCTLLSL